MDNATLMVWVVDATEQNVLQSEYNESAKRQIVLCNTCVNFKQALYVHTWHKMGLLGCVHGFTFVAIQLCLVFEERLPRDQASRSLVIFYQMLYP